MLKTPRFALPSDPELAISAFIHGPMKPPQEVERGFVTHQGFNFPLWIAEPSLVDDVPDLPNDMSCYGVCDTPQQLIDRCRETLEGDSRTFCVGLCHVAKNPRNKGNGGGWRWHKWGPYIGDGDPQYEYLDDEDGFDEGVWVYSVVQIGGSEALR